MGRSWEEVRDMFLACAPESPGGLGMRTIGWVAEHACRRIAELENDVKLYESGASNLARKLTELEEREALWREYVEWLDRAAQQPWTGTEVLIDRDYRRRLGL